MRCCEKIVRIVGIVMLIQNFTGCSKKEMVETNRVIMVTSLGEIEVELLPDKAPVSVENFLSYVRSGFYDKTIFHRTVEGFMIQGGGFDRQYTQKETGPPIVNEAANGLKNVRGALAYGRKTDINSATSQFYINHVDNPYLDHRDDSPGGYGYAVFGRVTRGMDVVDTIARAPTGERVLKVPYQGQLADLPAGDVPLEPIILKSVKIVMEAKE